MTLFRRRYKQIADTSHSTVSQASNEKAPDKVQDASKAKFEQYKVTRRQFALGGLAATGALAVGDIEYETQTIAVTHHVLPMPGLRAPCRVAQVSDLHRSWCVPENFIDRVVARVNGLAPDVVALTGDFVTHHTEYMTSCGRALQSLRAPQGLFAVLGNHDNAADNWRGGPVVAEHLTALNVQMLTNRSARLDNGLRLVGVDDFRTGRPDPDKAFKGVHRHEAVLALTHNPFAFSAMREYNCVTLAGHTHGGQIIVPGLTAHFVGARMRYQHGWYQEPRQPGRMYVSRGLGVVGMPFRYHCPPEIAVFDLTPA